MLKKYSRPLFSICFLGFIVWLVFSGIPEHIVLISLVVGTYSLFAILYLLAFVRRWDELRSQITHYKKREHSNRSTRSRIIEILWEENRMTKVALSIIGFLGGIYLLVNLERMYGPSPWKFEHLKKKMDRMIVYNLPHSMRVGEDTIVTASICKEMSDSALLEEIDEVTCEYKKVKVSSKVRLRLVDPNENKNFTIVPLSTDEQLIDEYSPTRWKWNIIPKRRGYKKLLLIATVYMHDKTTEYVKDIEVIEKRIKISPSFWTTVWQFVSLYWQFFATAIVLPIGAWVIQRIRARRSKPVSHLKYLARKA